MIQIHDHGLETGNLTLFG